MAQGFRNRMQGMHQLHLTMRGIKRKLGVTGQRKPRMPISVVTLKQIRSYINPSYANKLDRTMFWAASALAFFGFLRSSEYTAPTVKSYHRKSTLQRSDITIERTRMIVHVKASKTDPFREGMSLSIARTGSSMCPVRAIKKYCQVRPNMAGPLFCTSTGQYLTQAMMSRLVKNTLKANNINSDRYSSHSFRIGAATTAASAGIPDWTIKTLGRWSSDCYQRYIRLPLHTLSSIPSLMVSVKKVSKTWVPY